MTPDSLRRAATNRPDTSRANVARVLRSEAREYETPTGYTLHGRDLLALADALDAERVVNTNRAAHVLAVRFDLPMADAVTLTEQMLAQVDTRDARPEPSDD